MKQINEIGLESWFKPLPDKQCLHCGKVLHQRTHRVKSGDVYCLGIYEECDCPEARADQAAEQEAKAEKERYWKSIDYGNRVRDLMRELRIPKLYRDKTLQNYNVPPGDQHTLNVALRYVKRFEEMRKIGRGLYFSGTNGLGKTHLCYGIGRALVECERRVICRSATEIMVVFKGCYDGVGGLGEYDLMRQYISCDLLIVDDLGKEQVTDWSQAQLFSIFDGRYKEMRPTIVTTNYTDAALVDRLALKSDRETAASIVSRLHEMAYDVPMSGEDYRSR